MSVISNPLSPIRPINSTVNLTCTVELSSAVDIPVVVNLKWTGPAMFSRSSTKRLQGPANVTATSTINSFGRDNSGNYSCAVNITSTSPFVSSSTESLQSVRVTVGKPQINLPPPHPLEIAL